MRNDRLGIAQVKVLSREARVAARQGPAAFEKYLLSTKFRDRWGRIPQELWRRAMRTIDEAEALARKRDPLPPPVAPKPVGHGHTKSRWTPERQAQLHAAYAQARGDVAVTARLMRITRGCAVLALKRYPPRSTTPGLQEAA